MRSMFRSELGTTEDPNILIPGNVESIYRVARAMRVYGRAFEQVGSTLKKLDEGNYRGAAAAAFRQCFDMQPKRWLEAADAFDMAEGALVPYAAALGESKRRAAEAVALWKRGVELTRAAGAVNPLLLPADNLVGLGGALGGIDSKNPSDPGVELRAAARDMLHRARLHLSDIGTEAARKVREASEIAPPEPTLWQRFQGFLDGARGEVGGTLEVINPANWADVATGLAGMSDLALKDPVAAGKIVLDYETMRDDPTKWVGGMVAGALLGKGLSRISKASNLPSSLTGHVFEGHHKEDRITGYHHRYGGQDTGEFKVVKEGRHDENGVYRATVCGPNVEGAWRCKGSTFFPDDWTRAQVESVIERAFEARRPVYDSEGVLVPEKWQARVDGVLVEGKLDKSFTGSVDQAKLFDVETAYPKYNK
ncbi:EndoU domain-containing protein [Actinosynnema sp. NPDC023794]